MGLLQETLKILNENKLLKEEIVALYLSPGGRKKVADRLKLNYGTVGHLAKFLNIQPSRKVRHEISRNEVRYRNPFDNSDFGQYLLGYILGDGSIIYKDGDVQGVNLSSSDLGHLIRIRDLWDSSLKITGPIRGNYSINCYDRNIALHLLSLGFVPAKSKVGMLLNFQPSWPFIRGLFDSDGCVSYTNKGTSLRVQIAGHKSYINQIYSLFKEYGFILSDRGKITLISMYSKDNIEKLYNLMYSNSTIKMERKYERFYKYFKYSRD